MTHQNPRFGRTYHLANLDIDYDTDSPSYGHTARYMGYDPVPDNEKLTGQDGIGTWRLPQRPEECAEMLWRFWYIPGPLSPIVGKGKERREEGEDEHAARLAGEVMGYLQGVWYRSVDLAKKVSAKVVQRHRTPFNNLSSDSDPLSDPVDIVSARLTERWLYLRSKELVGLSTYVIYRFEAYLKTAIGDQAWLTTWPVDYLAYSRANDTIKPLEDSLLFAENDKEEGNQAMRAQTLGRKLTAGYFREGKYAHAALQYMNGLITLAPWYPLEWIMPAWESNLTGLTDMVFGLHLNLARCAIAMNQPDLGQICTFPVVRHPFATNRHMRKGWHLFGRAIALHMTPGTRETHAMPPSEFSTILIRHTTAFRQARYFAQFHPQDLWRQSEAGEFELQDIRDAALMLGQLSPEDHGASMLDLLVPSMLRRFQEATLRTDVPRKIWQNWTEDEDGGWAQIYAWYGRSGLPAAGPGVGRGDGAAAAGGKQGGVAPRTPGGSRMRVGQGHEGYGDGGKGVRPQLGSTEEGSEKPAIETSAASETEPETPDTLEGSEIMGWSPGRYGRGEMLPPVWYRPESPRDDPDRSGSRRLTL